MLLPKGARLGDEGPGPHSRKGKPVRHPRDRFGSRRAVGRREFLQRAGTASLGLPAMASVLAACADERSVTRARSFEIARPNRPVTLPITADNEPIADGLGPENNATLKVFNWAEYIRPAVVTDFEEKYKTKVKITTFDNMDEARQVLGSEPDFDVLFLRVDVLGKLVRDKLLRPLNHSYIPNQKANVWPVYHNPFYDQESRYTVPYTMYTTGIAWRVDRVDVDIPSLENPYDIYWDETYRGKINLFDDYREVISMALLRDGMTDLNLDDAALLERAGRSLSGAADLIGALSIDAYLNVPQDTAWIHQAYSGDMVAAPYYFPKGADPSVVRFWAPPDGRGAVGNDAIGVLRGGRNPVLAHLFIDYLLDFDVALKNYSWNGYQPPIEGLDPDSLVDRGLVAPYLSSVVIHRRDFNRGFMELELDPRSDRLWHRTWNAFRRRVEKVSG
jgi:spermidine/putrescine transport system substrate-binding protein